MMRLNLDNLATLLTIETITPIADPIESSPVELPSFQEHLERAQRAADAPAARPAKSDEESPPGRGETPVPDARHAAEPQDAPAAQHSDPDKASELPAEEPTPSDAAEQADGQVDPASDDETDQETTEGEDGLVVGAAVAAEAAVATVALPASAESEVSIGDFPETPQGTGPAEVVVKKANSDVAPPQPLQAGPQQGQPDGDQKLNPEAAEQIAGVSPTGAEAQAQAPAASEEMSADRIVPQQDAPAEQPAGEKPVTPEDAGLDTDFSHRKRAPEDAPETLSAATAEAAAVEPSQGGDGASSISEGRADPRPARRQRGASSADRVTQQISSSSVAQPETASVQAQSQPAAADPAATRPLVQSGVADPVVPSAPVVSIADGGAVAAPTVSTDGSVPAASATKGQAEPDTDQVTRARLVQRVARAFEAMGGDTGTIRLRLYPPELGSLRLSLNMRQGVMSAQVEVETASARDLLLDNLPALRERLAEHQIRVERFDVDLTGRSSGGSPQEPGDHPRPQEQSRDNGRYALGDRAAKRDEPAATRQATRIIDPGHLDVTI